MTLDATIPIFIQMSKSKSGRDLIDQILARSSLDIVELNIYSRVPAPLKAELNAPLISWNTKLIRK